MQALFETFLKAFHQGSIRAEKAGFEPARRLNPTYTLSRGASSASWVFLQSLIRNRIYFSVSAVFWGQLCHYTRPDGFLSITRYGLNRFFPHDFLWSVAFFHIWFRCKTGSYFLAIPLCKPPLLTDNYDFNYKYTFRAGKETVRGCLMPARPLITMFQASFNQDLHPRRA